MDQWPENLHRQPLERELQVLTDQHNQSRLSQIQRSLANLISSRDRAFMEHGKNSSQFLRQEKNVQEKRKELEEFQFVSLPDEAILFPLSIVKNGEEILHSPQKGNWQTLREQKKLDLVISARVRRIGDYLRVTFFSWNTLTKEERQIFEDSFLLGEMANRTAQWTREIRNHLAARPWSDVLVSVEPRDTAIFMGNELLGYGSVELRDREPGMITLRLARIGYATQEIQIQALESQENSSHFEMELLRAQNIALSSTPPGANVYLGSQWLGMTPLSVPAPFVGSLLTFKLPGFQEEELFARPLEEQSIEAALKPLGDNVNLRDAKDRFYKAMGAFTLSFFGTILINQVHGNQQALYLFQADRFSSEAPFLFGEELAAATERLNMAYTLEQSTYWTTVGLGTLSAGLLVYTFYELFRYIEVGEN